MKDTIEGMDMSLKGFDPPSFSWIDQRIYVEGDGHVIGPSLKFAVSQT